MIRRKEFAQSTRTAWHAWQNLASAGVMLGMVSALPLVVEGATNEAVAQNNDSDIPFVLPRDPFAEFCRLDEAGVTVFLVDQTDKYDTVDTKRLAEGAVQLFDSLEYGQRLDIYAILDRPGETTRLLSNCVPGCPDEYDASVETSIWTHQCDRIVLEQSKQQFTTLYVDMLRSLLSSGRVSDKSEIVRTLSIISQTYQSSQLDRIVIFSDMIENSDLTKGAISTFNLERAITTKVEALKTMPSDAFSGVSIEAFGFGKWLNQINNPKLKTLKLSVLDAFRDFWGGFFEDLGAESFSLQLDYQPRK